jgi:hypothetical protein
MLFFARVVLSLLFLLLFSGAEQEAGFAAKNLPKKKNLQPAAAKHHTHKLQVPGKHKEGAWFLGEHHHKAKTQPKEQEHQTDGKPQWTFGRVPRW